MSDIHETIRDQARQAIAESCWTRQSSLRGSLRRGLLHQRGGGAAHRFGFEPGYRRGALGRHRAGTRDRRFSSPSSAANTSTGRWSWNGRRRKRPASELVNAVPQLHAGGAFAATAYVRMEDPVMVEEVRAAAGIDIGGTLIGMQLRRVAVPVRLSIDRIGEARILCARTRPKFIGGVRAVYDESVL